MLTPEQLQAALNQAGLIPSSAVVHAVDGRGSPPVAFAPESYFYPASMVKTPLAAAALALAERGEFLLTDSFSVDEGCVTTNDAQSPFVLGFTAPLWLILERALTHSDNVATNMLFDICGRERASALVQNEFGLTNTAFFRKLSGSEPLIADPQWDGVNRNRHSAGDAARLFALIASDGVPHAALLRDFLARQFFNNKLSQGMDGADRFAHKTGDTDEVTHDGGILTLPEGSRYVIVVYTGLESTDEHNARFGQFMKAIRPHLYE
ncbi:MAG: hypothetical protein NVS9B12_15150 [Vulcanimicrobiaceae bacterium]